MKVDGKKPSYNAESEDGNEMCVIKTLPCPKVYQPLTVLLYSFALPQAAKRTAREPTHDL